jgi:hypothetical protein
MVVTGSDVETLRDILENIRNPGVLDAHPWVSRPFTRDVIIKNSKLRNVGPGEQLVGAL